MIGLIKGIVFFDYDGTLVDERIRLLSPTDQTKNSIKKLQENGYAVFLATGRAFCYVPDTIEDLQIDGTLTCNGAFARFHGEMLYEDGFELEQIQDIIHIAKEEGCNYFFETDKTCYVNDMEEERFKEFMEYYHIPYTNFESIVSLETISHKIGKITVIAKNHEHKEAVAKRFHKNYQTCLHRGSTSFDIGKKDVHKGAGVLKIASYLNVDRINTYAFGDGTNDYTMLKDAGVGIAMKQHALVLDEVCDYVTLSVEEEGITEALKVYGLI